MSQASTPTRAIPLLRLNFNHFGNTLEGNNLMARHGIRSTEYREAEAAWEAARTRKKGKNQMNELQIFNSPKFGEIRTIVRDNEPWFVAADVCRALEVGNPSDAIARLDDDEHTLVSIEGASNGLPVNAVNEPGLYALVLGSRKPEAKAFKRWITHEVIPALRKTGTYTVGQNNDDKLLRAQAMFMNARTRQFNAIMKTIEDKQKLSAIAVEVFGLKSIEATMGMDVGDLLPQTQKTFSATEVGERCGGISAQKIGKKANELGLKTKEYGIWVMDKSPYSSKEVEAFRYNENGARRLAEAFGAQ